MKEKESTFSVGSPPTHAADYGIDPVIPRGQQATRNLDWAENSNADPSLLLRMTGGLLAATTRAAQKPSSLGAKLGQTWSRLTRSTTGEIRLNSCARRLVFGAEREKHEKRILFFAGSKPACI